MQPHAVIGSHEAIRQRSRLKGSASNIATGENRGGKATGACHRVTAGTRTVSASGAISMKACPNIYRIVIGDAIGAGIAALIVSRSIAAIGRLSVHFRSTIMRSARRRLCFVGCRASAIRASQVQDADSPAYWPRALLCRIHAAASGRRLRLLQLSNTRRAVFFGRQW